MSFGIKLEVVVHPQPVVGTWAAQIIGTALRSPDWEQELKPSDVEAMLGVPATKTFTANSEGARIEALNMLRRAQAAADKQRYSFILTEEDL